MEYQRKDHAYAVGRRAYPPTRDVEHRACMPQARLQEQRARRSRTCILPVSLLLTPTRMRNECSLKSSMDSCHTGHHGTQWPAMYTQHPHPLTDRCRPVAKRCRTQRTTSPSDRRHATASHAANERKVRTAERIRAATVMPYCCLAHMPIITAAESQHSDRNSKKRAYSP